MDWTSIAHFYLNGQSALQFLPHSHTQSHTDGSRAAMQGAGLTIGSVLGLSVLLKDTCLI